MAKKQDGREFEMEALKSIPGIDPERIKKQLNPEDNNSGDNPLDKTPPVEKTEPVKTEEPIKKEEPVNKNVPDELAVRTAVLNEIFGDRYKTVDEVKQLNILDSLQERDSLRERITELEAQLGKKPKHSFASDDLAKFNEFARESKIESYEVFRKLNSTDIANMDDMDALIWQRISEDPELAGDISRVRKNFERKFNVDKAKIESGDLTQEEYEDNLFDMRTEARNAKKKLLELKGKIKMPEKVEETPEANDDLKRWTPEIEKAQKSKWSEGVKAIAGIYSKVPIPMKDAKDPVVNFVLPEEARQKLEQDALNYALSNQMEIVDTDLPGNQKKALAVAVFMRRQLLDENLDLIAHAIFERASGMTEEEKAKLYHNPTKINKGEEGGGDKPSTYDEKRQKAYDLEKRR